MTRMARMKTFLPGIPSVSSVESAVKYPAHPVRVHFAEVSNNQFYKRRLRCRIGNHEKAQ